MRGPRGHNPIAVKALGVSVVRLSNKTIRITQAACLLAIAIGAASCYWMAFGDSRSSLPGVPDIARKQVVLVSPEPFDPKSDFLTRNFQGQPIPKPKQVATQNKVKATIPKPSSELFVEGLLRDSEQPEQAVAFLNQGDRPVSIKSSLPGKWSGWTVTSINADNVEVVFGETTDQLLLRKRR